jgi:hypothetical protein
MPYFDLIDPDAAVSTSYGLIPGSANVNHHIYKNNILHLGSGTNKLLNELTVQACPWKVPKYANCPLSKRRQSFVEYF